jgi:nitronate monooxygenase
LSHFPIKEPVQRLLNNFYVDKPTDRPTYKRPPMWSLKSAKSASEVNAIANFVEVFLAREGHAHPVGLNLLEKIQMPVLSSLYGAMLAGVSFVIMGAGLPVQVPDAMEKMAEHEEASYKLDVQWGDRDDDTRIAFNPEEVFPGISEKVGVLQRPKFLPIISSYILAESMLGWTRGRVDGFVIETPVAGGHNAPPRGLLQRDQRGEPIYGEKDVVDLAKMKRLERPFWLAGGYDTPAKLKEAFNSGAAGIQVGTAFACCEESGMDPDIRRRVIDRVMKGDLRVRTDLNVSPTGYPFKVAEIDGTLSEAEVYEKRRRVCDIGLLRRVYKRADGDVGFRCPAEPEMAYRMKRGKPDETEGRNCLCNNLLASAGYPQTRKDGYTEPPIVTAGDGLVSIGRFLKPGKLTYHARDVIAHLLS